MVNKSKNLTILIGHLVKERHKLLYDFCLNLSNNGYMVNVITGFPTRRISKELINKYLNLPIEIINNNFIIYRVGTKKGEGNNLFTRFFKYIKLNKAIIKKAIELKNPVNIIFSTPPLLSFQALKLNKIYKSRMILYLQDIFPDSLFNLYGFLRFTPFFLIFRVIEKYTYRNYDLIITISQDMHNTISARTQTKIETITNWIDPNLRTINKNENTIFNNYSITKESFFLVYAGDIGNFQKIKLIALSSLQFKNYPIKIIFIGNGSFLSNLKNIIRKNNLSNIIILPLQPYDQLSMVYSLGDYQILPLRKNMYKFAFPSKFYNILACKTPILGLIESNSELANLITSNRIGSIHSTNNYIKLGNHIVNLYLLNKSNKTNFQYDNFDKLNIEFTIYNQLTKFINLLRN